jgi:hypothetical protein
MTAAFSIIEDGRTTTLEAEISHGTIRIAPGVVRDALGWDLKPEGLCRGDVCVPVRDRDHLIVDGAVDLTEFAAALGRPLAIDAEEGAAAIGIATADLASRMAGLEAPDFTLPDLEGRLHSLSEHRGKKVLLVAYASW